MSGSRRQTAGQAASAYQAALASPVRTADDRKDDARREPAEFLAFAQVGPGMKALDVASGAGATLPNLHAVVAGFDDPVPKGTPPLDLVTINMSCHDIANTPADRAAMNKRLYEALQPGGMPVIVDNAARKGSGLTATRTLHRIDEDSVAEEVARAGFRLDARSDYLQVAADPREQPFFKMDTPDDKFALRFRK